MVDEPRIDDLRRRVQQDPASIAFAQLAEEYRRAGTLTEAVAICRVGLSAHPTFLSARITLARALAALGELDDARREFETVLRSSPEHLPAVRGLADVLQRQGALEPALDRYRTALVIAPNDPALERLVGELSGRIDAERRGRVGRLADALNQWLTAIHVTRTQRRA